MRKQDVIDRCLTSMRTVFDTAIREEKTLEQAIQEFYEPLGGAVATTGSAAAAAAGHTVATNANSGGVGEILERKFTTCKCGQVQQLKIQG